MQRIDPRSFAGRVDGVSSVEFAVLAPVFIVILVGLIDLGILVNTKFKLNGAVSAASNYALINQSKVGSTNGATLAQSIASVVANQVSTNWANVTVVVNNGPAVAVVSGVTTTSGTASKADSCYCPTLSSGVVSWGSTATCGATCSSGGVAGKFVSISATTPYTSLFGAHGLVPSTTLTSSAVLETN